MWPPTHTVVAATVAEALFPGNRTALLVLTVASTWPDFPFLAQVGLNIKDGKSVAEYNRPWLLLLNNAAHSLPVWLAVFATSRVLPVIPAVVSLALWGWLSHILIDVLTHGRGKKFKGDPDLWPWRHTLGSVMGIYTYREPGCYKPKVPEVIISLTSVVLFVLLKKHIF